MLENSCRKTCGPLRLTEVLKTHTGVKKILLYVHQRQKLQFLREKGIRRGPLAEWVLPSPVGEVVRQRAAAASSQPHPSPLVAGDSVACSSLQFGRRRMW